MPFHAFTTALGRCALGWEGEAVTAFRLPPGDVPAASETPPESVPAWVQAIAVRVQRHLAGDLQDFADVPFAFAQVSDFQQRLYRAALSIKAGRTETYGGLAAAIGQPPAVARAVGTALGQNPWPLLVPCHRFIGADGRMTGFSGPGGIATKRKLLALEGAQLFAE